MYPPSTWSTAKLFLNRRDGAIPRVSRALGGESGTYLPKSLYALYIFFRSQKETVFLAISFVLRSEVTNSRLHCGRCAAVRSHCDLCSCLVGWYSKFLKPRSIGGGVLRLRYKTCNEGEGHLASVSGVRDTMQKGVKLTNPLSRGKG